MGASMPALLIIDWLVAIAFAGLSVAAVRQRSRDPFAGLVIGSALTALWAAAVGTSATMPSDWQAAPWLRASAGTLDILRLSAWLLTLLLLVKPGVTVRSPPPGGGAAVATVFALAAIAIIFDAGPELGFQVEPWLSAGLMTHLAYSVVGLIVIENVWRNAAADRLWSLKFLLI